MKKPVIFLFIISLLLAVLTAFDSIKKPVKPPRASLSSSPENPFNDARIVWHMKPVVDKDTNFLSLKQNGTVRIEKLDSLEYTESLRRGGDGYVADLKNEACLSLGADRARSLRPFGNIVTLGARVWFAKQKKMMVFFSDFIGLAIDPSGMAIAFLGEKIPSGVTLRELPLTQVKEGSWMDLVLRVGKGKLDFFCNGSLQISVPVEGDLRSPGSWPLHIGGMPWGRRTSTTSNLFGTSNFFEGKIDHLALWDYSLTDNQVARLSGLSNLNKPREKDGASVALDAFHRFFYASIRKDVKGCAQEEKIMRSFMNQDKQVVIYPHHDGHTWREGNTWYSITCQKRPGATVKSVVLFTSTDLDHWSERGVIYTPTQNDRPLATVGYFEFPYLLTFGDKDVLMIGGRPCYYWIGRLDRKTFQFIPDHPTGLLLDYRNPFHCFNPSAVDQKGPGGSSRRIIMAMAIGVTGEFHGIPWHEMHAMPRSLALDGNRLRQDPLPEFEVLRGAHISQKDIMVKPDGLGYIQKQGDMLEIIAEFEPGDARVFGLKVRLSDDGKTFARIFYDTATSEYGLDGNIAGREDLVKGPTYISKGNPVKIHVYLDKCLVETFVNGQTCTALLKDKSLKNLRLDLFTEGGTATCKSLDIWDMKRN